MGMVNWLSTNLVNIDCVIVPKGPRLIKVSSTPFINYSGIGIPLLTLVYKSTRQNLVSSPNYNIFLSVQHLNHSLTRFYMARKVFSGGGHFDAILDFNSSAEKGFISPSMT